MQTTDRLRLVHSGPVPYDKIHLMTIGMAFGISRDSRFVQVVGVAADKNEEVYCTQHVVRERPMDGITGSASSLVDLSIAMSQVRTQNAISISAVKKGLDAQSEAALSLIDAVQQVRPPSNGGSGSQIDVMA